MHDRASSRPVPASLLPARPALAARLPRRPRGAGALASWLVFLVLAALFIAFRPVTLGGATQWTFVAGSSMEPGLHTGDLAIVVRQADYTVGDIVSYHPSAAPAGLIIHRVIGGDAGAGYVVKGDNKDAPDPDRPAPAAIVGRAIVVVPGLGWVLHAIRHPLVLAALAAVVTLGLVWDELRKRDARKGAR